MRELYLDYNANTPLLPEVYDAMHPWLVEYFGNATATGPHASRIRKALEESRITVASFINANPDEIIFTSGATEANNMVLSGIFTDTQGNTRASEVLIGSTEHSSIERTAYALTQKGVTVNVAEANENGIITAEIVEKNCTARTELIAIMLANHNTGVIHDIPSMTAIAQQIGALFHCDAAQAAGRIDIDVKKLNTDYLSLSSQKMYGPSGIGALFIRNVRVIKPLLHGCGQEKGLRPGTLSIANIVGFAKACEIASTGLEFEMERIAKLREILLYGFATLDCPFTLLGSHNTGEQLPSTINISFHTLDAQKLGECLEEMNISAAICNNNHATCSFGHKKLQEQDYAKNCLRISLGRQSTRHDVEEFLSRLGQIFAQKKQELFL